MVWGLVASVSISVFGFTVGLICYCHYRRGGLHITTRGQIRYNRGAGTIENMGAESVPLEEVRTGSC